MRSCSSFPDVSASATGHPITTAEFAFLSARHETEVTGGGIADEVLCLASVLQYCGFQVWSGSCGRCQMKIDGIWPSLLLVGVLRQSAGVPCYERSSKGSS